MNEQINTYHLNPFGGIAEILPRNPQRIALIVFNNDSTPSQYGFDELAISGETQFIVGGFSVRSWLRSDYGELVGGSLVLLNAFGQCTIICEVLCLPKARYKSAQQSQT